MPDLVLSVTNPTGCRHRHLTLSVQGRTITRVTHLDEPPDPLSDLEAELFADLCARLLAASGLSWADALNRVLHGEEATNVKVYDIIGAGAAVTKTNIGTAYVDVLPGANGQRALIDFTGCTEFRPILNANLAATGPFGIRLIRDGDSTVLYENANIALTGERELDPDWQPLPAGFSGLTLVRLQAKSSVAQDDPVFRRCLILVR